MGGGFPINDVNLCQRAAAVLGVPDKTASTTSAVNRPEGCYVFRGFFLFMGVNPQSKGKGAETSTPGRSRHPICGFTSLPSIINVLIISLFSEEWFFAGRGHCAVVFQSLIPLFAGGVRHMSAT